jgi:hypothetical protein
MKAEAIIVQVPPRVATAYRAASEEDRARLDLWVSVQLTKALNLGDSLGDVKERVGREAAADGLTPETPEASLFDFLSGYIGTIDGTGDALSTDCGQHFANGLTAKNKEGNL